MDLVEQDKLMLSLFSKPEVLEVSVEQCRMQHELTEVLAAI